MLRDSYNKAILALALSAGIANPVMPVMAAGHTVGIGVVSPLPAGAINRINIGHSKRLSKVTVKSKKAATHAAAVPVKAAKGKAAVHASKADKHAKGARKGKKVAAQPMRPPQEEANSLSQVTLAPGVVHKFHRGPLSINIIDVDLKNPNIEVKPILAGDAFNRLDEVRDQAQKVNAIAAVNANYFKKDGTPLGTLVMDGEWVAGPLYDRISFGLTESGQVHVDRANLHGTIETSNTSVGKLWVNNINQPRRSGCKIVAYTRRWGNEVKMPYAGTVVAIDANGHVVDKATQNIAIPYNGFVLTDTKYSVISKLNKGDSVFLEWHHKPEAWSDVVQAVSGGPYLIKNGNLFLDLKDENFRKTWSSNSIHARTALGVTADHHLILATVEGPHTLWDLAKMLHKLGCVEAMNLDGGGSTTMVVHGNIVTRNKNTFQRRVAASLAVLSRAHAPSMAQRHYAHYVPDTDVAQIFHKEPDSASALEPVSLADPIANDIQKHVLNGEAVLPELAAETPETQAKTSQAAEIARADDEGSVKLTKHGKQGKSIGKSLSKSLELGWMKGWLGK